MTSTWQLHVLTLLYCLQYTNVYYRTGVVISLFGVFIVRCIKVPFLFGKILRRKWQI